MKTALWQSAETAVITGDLPSLERLLGEHPELTTSEPPPHLKVDLSPCADATADHARAILVREHQFDSFNSLTSHFQILKATDNPVSRFEAAVDAVVEGNISLLQQLLEQNLELIRARSTRKHHCTLLHYVGANGVENWRQKTPPNAIQVAETLLQAGAEVDATADLYRGGETTLFLAATSIFPTMAGLIEPLLDLLISAGANISDPRLINSCLANGRRQSAEFLAKRGAPLDLEGAAGVGRLHLVHSWFTEDGRLKDPATPDQLRDAFAWACEFGRAKVVTFLLHKGISADTKLKHHGQTGLHWAAYGGHSETLKLLLEAHSPINALDDAFHGTPLGWAIYGWANTIPEANPDSYYEVIRLLLAAGAQAEPQWLSSRGLQQIIQADPRMNRLFQSA